MARLLAWPALVLLVAAGASIQLLRPLPKPVTHMTLGRPSNVPGHPAPIPWPAQGEGAVEVPALGLVLASAAEQPVPIASLTKVMTAYIVLRDHPLSPASQGPGVTLSVSDQNEAEAEEVANDANVPVQAGEVLSERQLLDGLLVHSADNLADVLANWDAGSLAEFVSKMNEVAGQLAMTTTHYVDASGLDPRSVSTAADQLRLAAVAMRNPTFAAVVAQPSISLPIAGLMTNYVRQIGTDGIVGVKSGFTQAAMGCLVLAAQREVGGKEVTVMAAVTGQQGPDPLDAAADATVPLIDAAAASLREVSVLTAGTRVARVVVPWSSDEVQGAVASSVVALVWPGQKIRFSTRTLPVRQGAPKGTTLGYVTVSAGAVRVRVPVRSEGKLPTASVAWRLENF